MIKQIIFATKYKEFEDKILDYINTQQREDTYVAVRNATHLDDIVDKCIQLRPSVLVIREEPSVDLLKIVRDLKMSNLPNIHIVAITSNHMSGDPLLNGLIMYGVYDFITAPKFTHADIGELIIHPRTLKDVQNYVPVIDKSNGKLFTSSNPNAEEVTQENSFVESSRANGTVADYQTVAHAENLTEIVDSKEDKTLYSEAAKRASGIELLNIGEKLSYNPLFDVAKSKPKQTPKREAFVNSVPQRVKEEVNEPVIDDVQEEPSVEVIEETPKITPVETPKVEEVIHYEQSKVEPEKPEQEPVIEEVEEKQAPRNAYEEALEILRKEGLPVPQMSVPTSTVPKEAPKPKVPEVPKVKPMEQTKPAETRVETPKKQEAKKLVETPKQMDNEYKFTSDGDSFYKWFNRKDLHDEVFKFKKVIARVNPAELSDTKDIEAYEDMLRVYRKALAESNDREARKGDSNE